MSLLEKFRKRDVVGMDWGEGCVKFVILAPGERGTGPVQQLQKRLCYPRPIVGNPAAIATFKSFLKNKHLEGASVCCNIEHESLKIRKVDLPAMDTADLQEAVAWKMREVVDGPVESYVVRYSLLEQYAAGDTKRLSLLAFAIDRQVVHARENSLKELGFKPVLLEPTSVSVAVAFSQVCAWDEKQLYAIMDLGKSKTVFTIVGGGKLLFSRPLPHFSLSDIEKICTVFPEGGSGMSEKDLAVLNDFYTQLAVEAQRSLDAFALLFGQQRVGTLLLCGGGAALPDLPSHLATSLGIKAELINPFTRWQVAQTPDSFLFVAATGLALYHSE